MNRYKCPGCPFAAGICVHKKRFSNFIFTSIFQFNLMPIKIRFIHRKGRCSICGGNELCPHSKIKYNVSIVNVCYCCYVGSHLLRTVSARIVPLIKDAHTTELKRLVLIVVSNLNQREKHSCIKTMSFLWPYFVWKVVPSFAFTRRSSIAAKCAG